MVYNYLLVHAVFTVPILLLLYHLQPKLPIRRSKIKKAGFLFLLALCYSYTIPWDNLIIAAGAWSYADSAVSIRIWNAPLGEYVFFGIQTLISGFWLYWIGFDPHPVEDDTTLKTRIGGLIVLISIAVLSYMYIDNQSSFYAVSIILWCVPVISLQWIVGGAFLSKKWRLLIRSIVPPTLYLCTVDYIAIYLGFWEISAEHTLGLKLGILPFEEILFFFATTCMVVFGLILFEWAVKKWSLGVYASKILGKIRNFRTEFVS